MQYDTKRKPITEINLSWNRNRGGVRRTKRWWGQGRRKRAEWGQTVVEAGGSKSGGVQSEWRIMKEPELFGNEKEKKGTAIKLESTYTLLCNKYLVKGMNNADGKCWSKCAARNLSNTCKQTIKIKPKRISINRL